MKSAKKISIFAIIIAVWLTAMLWLLRREYFSTNTTAADYRQTLKNVKQRKLSRLGVYYGPEQEHRIGEIQTIMTPQADGTFDINTRTKFSFPIKNRILSRQVQRLLNIPKMGKKNFEVGLMTKVHIGPDYQIKDIAFRLQSNLFNVTYEGQVKTGKLLLAIQKQGKTEHREVALPPGTMLTDNIGLMGKFPRLEVGKSFKMRWFDPLTRSYQTATSKVLGKMDYNYDGKIIPVYVVRSNFGALATTAWVAEDGRVLKYQLLSLTFIEEPLSKKAIEQPGQK